MILCVMFILTDAGRITIGGAPMYTLTNLQAKKSDAGIYGCFLTNQAGSGRENYAKPLVVHCEFI